MINGRVGFKHKLPCKKVHVGGEFAIVIHRSINIKVVVYPHLIVFLSVSRCSMNAARPCFQGDVIACDQQGFPLNEGMAAFETFKGRTGECVQDLVVFNFQCTQRPQEQTFSNNIDFILHLYCRIGKVGMKGDGKVRRQGPGGGCPDNNINHFVFKRRDLLIDIRKERKLDINGRG